MTTDNLEIIPVTSDLSYAGGRGGKKSTCMILVVEARAGLVPDEWTNHAGHLPSAALKNFQADSRGLTGSVHGD